jgi:hypothetical protein
MCVLLSSFGGDLFAGAEDFIVEGCVVGEGKRNILWLTASHEQWLGHACASLPTTQNLYVPVCCPIIAPTPHSLYIPAVSSHRNHAKAMLEP